MGWWIVRDIAGVMGAGMVSFGTWEVFHPAGVIVSGAFLLGGAWLSAKRTGAE